MFYEYVVTLRVLKGSFETETSYIYLSLQFWSLKKYGINPSLPLLSGPL